MARRARGEFSEPAAQLEHAGFEVEDQRLQPAGEVTLGSGMVGHGSA
jgi:hypothetical protein